MPPTLRAPELDGGLAWLNTEEPLSIRDLRGAVVVLDFWTYCCINCMHVVPTLRAIEERFAGEPVVVIGVHSGKFSAERDPARIREAIGRYGVQHPVVVDDRMAIWSRYAIRSWPTLVVIRPDGTIAAVAPGEPDLATLTAFIERELGSARDKGLLARSAPKIVAPPTIDRGALRYPGKVSILPDGALAITDSGHHRLLVVAPTGEVLHAAGSGLRGLADGPLATAAFDDPQGTAWHDGALYVADTRNHAIRRVDLAAGVVTTVAGTGELGARPPEGLAEGTETALRSPWDLCAVGDAIYVAMAGSHQIWRFHPKTGAIEVYAGTGIEALIDGDVRESAWAQPSGLSARGGTLFVADSETSAIRAIDLEAGAVRTLVGQGLFDFGDDEGSAEDALLQHGLGVAAIEGALLIADTYNGKIKRLDDLDGAGHVRTVLAGLDEPGAIVVERDGAWIIADTNAHRVVRVTNGEARAIVITGAPEARRGSLAPARASRTSAPAVEGWFTTLLDLEDGAGLAPGDGTITLHLAAAPCTELAAGAPVRVALEVSRRSDLLEVARAQLSIEAPGGPAQDVAIRVRVGALPDACIDAEIVATIDYLACASGDRAACFPRRVHARVPVRLLAAGGQGSLEFALPLPAAYD